MKDDTHMFEFTLETNKNIDEAIQGLEESLKEEKFGILWKFYIKEKLQEKGLDFNKEFKVLEVCNPHEAQRVLNENQMAGYFLPCKIVVYDDHGKTKIGMPKPSSLIGLLNDHQLQEFAKDIEERLIKCIRNSV
jgi:uncharacterized protein (DUF302 family)